MMYNDYYISVGEYKNRAKEYYKYLFLFIFNYKTLKEP